MQKRTIESFEMAQFNMRLLVAPGGFRESAVRLSAAIILSAMVSALGAQAAQPELRAPWKGSAIIGQGNHGPRSHNVCGQRTLDPGNCAWENSYAIDIDIPYNSEVLAAADGVVTYTSDDISPSGGRQMAVTSTGPDGTQTTHVYMHLSAISIYSGHVNQGQPIAKSGASSDGSEYGTSPHLHFHVWAGIGHHDSHTVPIENLLLQRSGSDSTFRRYNETNGDLEHDAIVGATFESNNATSSGISPSPGGGAGTFAIGSRVAATINAPDNNATIAVGDQGTVTCLFPAGTNYDLMVDWDKDVNGSAGIGTCEGTTHLGHGWAVKSAWVMAASGSRAPVTNSAPRIDYFNPSSVPLNTATWIIVNGANLQNGFSATVQGYAIATLGLRYISNSQVSVQVFMGGTTGYTANMVIRNPDGQIANGNFQVQ